MRIKLLTSAATPFRGFDKGEIVDWPDAKDALNLIAKGLAEAVEDEDAPHPKSAKR